MHDPARTQMGAPPAADPNRTVLGAPTMDPNRTVMGSPSFDATITIKPIQCPVCRTYNPVGVKFCVECGLVLDMALDGDAFGAPAVQLPVLVESTGREHILRPGVTVIGRQGDITVEDTRVSRRHAQVTSESNGVFVEDLGSTNGTSVAGSKLAAGEKRRVENGSTISLGGFELRLGLPGEANKTLAAMSGKTAAMTAAPSLDETKAWLVLADREIPLLLGTHVFGRRAEHPISIPDPYVSGQHGVFEVTEQGVFLTDTGSTNGTVVNDAKLAVGQRTQIRAEDVITLGQIEIRVRFRG